MQTHTALALACATLGLATKALAQTYDMTIDTQASHINADIHLDIDTTGTLIGAWNPDTNPESTRTKPGLFGSFGSTENLPVDVALGFGLAGQTNTATAGSMRLAIDLNTRTLTLENFNANMLAGGPIVLPATLGFASESFRTRNPNSAYIGVPFEVPIGDLTISALNIVQTSNIALGALTETSTNHYDITIAAPGELTGSIDFLGLPIDIPPTPLPIVLAGELVLTGQSATFTSMYMINQSDSQNPGIVLPEFPLDIPTILPPGFTSHLLMNMTLDQIASSLIGDWTLAAQGDQTTCRADFNNDGSVNTIDFIAYLNAWSAQDQSADFNSDGQINTIDFVAFLNTWVAGC